MKEKNDIQTDIIVIGAGLSGLALCCILAEQNIQVVCVDRADPKDILGADFDGRTTAISVGSRNVLQRTGIWDSIIEQGCAIQDIQIMDNSSPVLLEFLSQDADEDAFGWIFENQLLRQALYNRAKSLKTLNLLAPESVEEFSYTPDDQITVKTNSGQTITASLLIGADGRQSAVRKWAGIQTREWSYNQMAVICTVTHSQPHRNIAIEDFRNEGPFAILPMTDDKNGLHRSSVVWSNHTTAEDENPAHWPKDVFETALNARFPDFYGDISVTSARGSYPLGLIHAHHYIEKRTALIADAAHAIHPIAGQGLNLGYRDVDVLSDLLIKAHKTGGNLGNTDLLENYQRKRRLDVTSMVGTTDILNRLFSNKSQTLGIARKIGLKAVQKIKPARKFFMNQAMGKSILKTKD